MRLIISRGRTHLGLDEEGARGGGGGWARGVLVKPSACNWNSIPAVSPHRRGELLRQRLQQQQPLRFTQRHKNSPERVSYLRHLWKQANGQRQGEAERSQAHQAVDGEPQSAVVL